MRMLSTFYNTGLTLVLFLLIWILPLALIFITLPFWYFFFLNITSFAIPSYAIEINDIIYRFFVVGHALPSNVFSSQEAAHLIDVKGLVWMIFFVALMLLILSIFFIFRDESAKTYINKKQFRLFLTVLLAITTVSFLITSLFYFDFLFSAIHQLVFTNDWWLFPSGTLLVQIYPIAFFHFMTVVLLTLILSTYILVLTVFHKIKR